MFVLLVFSKLLAFIIGNIFYKEREILPFFRFLKGKVFKIELVELDLFLVFVFACDKVEIFHFCPADVFPDCIIRINDIVFLFDVCNFRKCFVEALKTNLLEVSGNIELFQQFMLSIRMISLDLYDVFIPWCNDVIIEIISRLIRKNVLLFIQNINLVQNCFVAFITQNWQLAPTSKEVCFFCNEVIKLQSVLRLMLINLRALEDCQ